MSQLPMYNKRPLTQEEIAACLDDMTPDGMTEALADDHQMVLVRLDDLRKALGVASIPEAPEFDEETSEMTWTAYRAMRDGHEALYSDHPAALCRLAEAAAGAPSTHRAVAVDDIKLLKGLISEYFQIGVELGRKGYDKGTCQNAAARKREEILSIIDKVPT